MPDSVPVVPAAFDEGPGRRGRIGLLVLGSDPVCEIECATYLEDGWSLHVGRIPDPADFSPGSFAGLEPGIVSAAGSILPRDRVDCIAIACASAATVIGRERLKSRLQAQRPGIAVTDPAQAALAVLKGAAVRRIALLLTTADRDVNARTLATYRDSGLTVVSARTFAFDTDREMSTATPACIAGALLDVDHPEAEVILVPCTALRTWQAALQPACAGLRPKVLTGNRALMLDAAALVDGRPRSMAAGGGGLAG